MKKILITNDDGIFANGIIRLAEAAKIVRRGVGSRSRKSAECGFSQHHAQEQR